MMAPLRFYLLMVIPLAVIAASTRRTCEQGSNCRLPDCFCSTYQHFLNNSHIPQIVYFGFDDAVTTVLPKYYDRLFPESRRNPNGCPIGMTLYVSHMWTSYSLVEQYYERGMEIAVHSVTHSHITKKNDIEREATQQRINIVRNTKIPEGEIVGWRSPFLQTAGDDQASVLQKLGYKYDVSLTYKRTSLKSQNPFPFTLDYGWPFYCQITPCPTHNHTGFWEFPVNAMIDYKGQYPCGYVDGCTNAPKTEEDSYKYLYKNFISSYKGNRAPFGLHMHAGWFYTQFHLDAMDRFIQDILKFDDVYIVTTKQALAWMQDPVSLQNIKQYPKWLCGSAQKLKTTPPPPPPTTTTTTTSTTTTTTLPPPTTRATRTRWTWPTWRRRPTTRRFIPWQWANNMSVNRKTNAPRISVTTKAPTTTTTTTTTSTTPTTTTTTTMAPTTQRFRLPPPIPGVVPNRPVIITSQWLNVGQLQNLLPNMNFNNINSVENPPETTTKQTPAPPIPMDRCIPKVNCKLPNCHCASTAIPGGIKMKEAPQMVFLTFDGIVDGKMFQKYAQLFSGKRRNPNGCPISATFFVTQMGSYTNYIQRLRDIGGDIAMRGYSGSSFYTSVAMDAEMRLQVRQMKRIGITDIGGWRSPGIKPLGDAQFKSVHDNGLLYDSTLTVPLVGNNDKLWPFTLDFGWKKECVIRDCPKKSYPGLWEIPNTPIMDYRNLYPCNFVDGCINTPPSANDTFNFLWRAFTSHYNTNKAPFGLHFRHIWFKHILFKKNLRGLEMFLDKLAELNDVYILSIKNVIDWIKSPTPLSELSKSDVWRC